MFQEGPSGTIASVLIITTSCKKKKDILFLKGSKVRVVCHLVFAHL